METIPMSRLRRELKQHMRRINRDQSVILITRNRKPVAYMMPPELAGLKEIPAADKEK